MDAAVTARALGADDVFVVFGGSRAELHWHLPEAWFAAPGVHALMLCRPLGYTRGDRGQGLGLRVEHTELGMEAVLEADLVIEAMGLEIDEDLRRALAGVTFGDHGLVAPPDGRPYFSGVDKVFVAGALVNGGASVARCVAEGVAAAAEIDRCLS
jgi:NADPH-dependent glutamate synthase beta subunit-like oxidoreductase